MAGKQFHAIREFRHSHPKTFVDTDLAVGDPYTGPVEDNQISPEGPDGQGPVIAETATAEKAAPTPVAPATSTKEK